MPQYVAPVPGATKPVPITNNAITFQKAGGQNLSWSYKTGELEFHIPAIGENVSVEYTDPSGNKTTISGTVSAVTNSYYGNDNSLTCQVLVSLK